MNEFKDQLQHVEGLELKTDLTNLPFSKEVLRCCKLCCFKSVDSLLVLQELGAVILDIQNMSEYGMEKLKN